MRISDWSSDVCSSDLLVDHTTVSAKIARRLAEEAASKGLLAVDAPVSGGQAGAESGQLAIMCGGSAEAFSAAEPAMQAYAKRIVHVGEAGSGQLAKMVNQIAIAGLVQIGRASCRERVCQYV